MNDVKSARSPEVYPEDSKVNSLFRNAKNLTLTYASLLHQDFTNDLLVAKNARGNGYYKLEYLEFFLKDAIKQLRRVQKLKAAQVPSVNVPSINNLK